MILAFALAMNNTNTGYESLQAAGTERERRQALRNIRDAQNHCSTLRDAMMRHCEAHGC